MMRRVRRRKLVPKALPPLVCLEDLPAPAANPPPLPRTELKAVDWNAWREAYVLYEERESVARCGRTSVASCAGYADESETDSYLNTMTARSQKRKR